MTPPATCTSRSASIDALISRTALPGFPTVSRSALAENDIDHRAIRRRLHDGRLYHLWGATLLVGVRPTDITPDLLLAASLVTVGSDAQLDDVSALERRDLWDRHDGCIYVTSSRSHAPIAFHVPRSWRSTGRWKRRRRTISITFTKSTRRSIRPGDVIGGIPTRSAIDALFRAAQRLTPYQLAFVIDRGQYRHEFSLEDIEAELQRRRSDRSPGSPDLRMAVNLRRLGSAGTKSNSEDLVLPHVTALFGVPMVNVRGAAGIVGHEPDFCWQDRRLILEIDGPHHDEDPGQRATDLARDAELRARGWIIVRIHWSRVWDDLPDVLSDIRAASAP